MTTLAWDGKTLACDRRITVGDMKSEGCKLHQISKNHWVAFSGNVEQCHVVIQWLQKKIKKPETIEDIDILMVDTERGKCYRIGDTMLAIEQTVPISLGSGYMAAMAAMVLGCNAVRAIEVAALVDTYTGGGVDSITIKPKKGRKR